MDQQEKDIRLALCAEGRTTLAAHQELDGTCRQCGTAFPCKPIRALASMWSDDPSFKEEWRV